VRLIDETGKNLGIVKIQEALEKAKEKGLDLIEISAKTNPPVCKIMEMGKFKYKESQKKKKKTHKTETREIRLNLGTSEHDLEFKAKKITKFLEKGDRVKIELLLKGRAKYLDKSFIEERLKRILNFINVKYKIASEPKRGPQGVIMIIEKYD
jgi:translation initiation factor IF-3